MSAWLDRLNPPPTRRELIFVGAAIALGVLLALGYVIVTRGHTLVGDEVEYDLEAKLAVAGNWFWSSTPYGDPHASTWKAPGYGAFLGVVYNVLGSNADRALALQAILVPPFTIGLTWLLARRLFGVTAGVLAALIVALYPNAWQFEVRLYSEALAIPLTVAVLLAVFTARELTWRRVVLVGGLLGVVVLVRPSSIVLIPPIAVCWWALGGARTGTSRLAATLAIAALVVAPWSIRNATLPGPWVPISVQSAAGYGVFNDDSANDPDHPWAWRPLPRRDAELFEVSRTDGELYRELNSRMFDYIGDHPSSVPKAFFWNGLVRLYDVRAPGQALDETAFEGRTRSVAAAGLVMYWVLAVLAIAGMVLAWRRGRRALVIACVSLAAAAAIVYTTDGGTRYRAPLEPLIVVLASSVIAPMLGRTRLGSELSGEGRVQRPSEDESGREPEVVGA
jgi:4-amino-4-deoxy-L-arabinose transferase-like glycosyltransferase